MDAYYLPIQRIHVGRASLDEQYYWYLTRRLQVDYVCFYRHAAKTAVSSK
jgi:hypothetical protein